MSEKRQLFPGYVFFKYTVSWRYWGWGHTENSHWCMLWDVSLPKSSPFSFPVGTARCSGKRSQGPVIPGDPAPRVDPLRSAILGRKNLTGARFRGTRVCSGTACPPSTGGKLPVAILHQALHCSAAGIRGAFLLNLPCIYPETFRFPCWSLNRMLMD